MTLFGPEELSQQILDPGLCTLCGACANICPYIKVHNNKAVKKCMELGMLDDDFKSTANLKDKQTITGVS